MFPLPGVAISGTCTFCSLHEGQVVVEGIPRPTTIESLNHGVLLTNYSYDDDGGRLTISVSMTMRDDLNNVFKLSCPVSVAMEGT